VKNSEESSPKSKVSHKIPSPNLLGDPEKEIKRALGMVIIRGENIVSITAEAPPNVVNQIFLFLT
jgi:small nuclear ribonucleoprotein (snRNP)-like protein